MDSVPEAALPTPPAEALDDRLRAAADRFIGRLLDATEADRQRLCAALRINDPALFALVASLTAHLDALDAFLEQPLRSTLREDASEALTGQRFGHWNVLRPIGRGGMGLVFEVERADGVVRQRAALKLLQRSDEDASIAQRFATERQILARLEHPNIARLIDAGASATRRPYLVMEYVDGVPRGLCERRRSRRDMRPDRPRARRNATPRGTQAAADPVRAVPRRGRRGGGSLRAIEVTRHPMYLAWTRSNGGHRCTCCRSTAARRR